LVVGIFKHVVELKHRTIKLILIHTKLSFEENECFVGE